MAFDPATERYEQIISVQPQDIDQFNHVNNIVYLRWVQDVSIAHWYASATNDQKEKIGWVVVRHEIDYINSARLGDEVIARTWVGGAEKNIFERFTEMIRSSDLKVLAHTRTLWCPIDLRSHRPIRVGADVYERFSVPNKKL